MKEHEAFRTTTAWQVGETWTVATRCTNVTTWVDQRRRQSDVLHHKNVHAMKICMSCKISLFGVPDYSQTLMHC